MDGQTWRRRVSGTQAHRGKPARNPEDAPSPHLSLSHCQSPLLPTRTIHRQSKTMCLYAYTKNGPLTPWSMSCGTCVSALCLGYHPTTSCGPCGNGACIDSVDPPLSLSLHPTQEHGTTPSVFMRHAESQPGTA
ncbi:hypothetical protein COCSADRAFT_318795 [Bipolaris sorokiniana ND90Pr]|uniref:Uncharacterized protein n=1 Tax=Cochliobolus sativus (strain ND90Pr / ATCC 201652) TaxID=665912 RepID=M2REI7_COCSN|nr:uncharacterized protein COCSADRAFT_318795 [Bipolaris sorokiniana ND90Pr]EMD65174.1 hypothetical protein COCSADRAFT_318795 [Bipolaris sorokiniana ND90Pr]